MRKFEYGADAYAAKHSGAYALTSALKKLARENFVNLTPLPIVVMLDRYARFMGIDMPAYRSAPGYSDMDQADDWVEASITADIKEKACGYIVLCIYDKTCRSRQARLIVILYMRPFVDHNHLSDALPTQTIHPA